MSPCVRRVRKICKIRFFDEFSRKLSRSPPRRDARSVKMRGGPSPSVVEPCLLGSLGPKALQRGVRTSRRGPSDFSSWAPSWVQVRSFSQFVCIFCARCLEVAFFTVSRWFLNGFWEVWGRFWGCFGNGFSHDFQKHKFLKK